MQCVNVNGKEYSLTEEQYARFLRAKELGGKEFRRVAATMTFGEGFGEVVAMGAIAGIVGNEKLLPLHMTSAEMAGVYIAYYDARLGS